MSNPQFPTLSKGQDSKHFDFTPEDPSLQTPMDGGYMASRAKHTRTPRLTFKSGFTEITNDDKNALMSFYNQVKGGSVIFDWIHPVDGTTYSVRFKGKLNFVYAGIGSTARWNVTFTIEQV